MSKHRIKVSRGNEVCALFREMYKKFKHLHKHKITLFVKDNHFYIFIYDWNYWIIWRTNCTFQKYKVINGIPNCIANRSMSKDEFILTIKDLLKH